MLSVRILRAERLLDGIAGANWNTGSLTQIADHSVVTGPQRVTTAKRGQGIKTAANAEEDAGDQL